MDSDTSNRPDDEQLSPSEHTTAPNLQQVPDTSLNADLQVPQDLTDAGHDTNLPRTSDSPESLDAEITAGADRERIDPHHSVTYNKTNDDSTDFTEDN